MSDFFLASDRLSWTALKAMATAKTLGFQYQETAEIYRIFLVDSCAIFYWTELWKGTVPPGADQTQNDADKTDWETSYQASANAPIVQKVDMATIQLQPHGGAHAGNGGDPVPNATTSVAGLLSASDKTKLDGVGALTSSAPVDVTKAAAAVGVATTAARGDHKHDVSTAAAAGLTDSSNAEGTATSLARSDHTHGHGNRGGGSLHADAVDGGAAGFMPGADKTKVALITQGTCRVMFPTDAAIKSASGVVDASTNNNMAALAFRNQAAVGEIRWAARPPQNRVSGDVTFRLYCTVINTPGANDTVVWDLSYKFTSDGEDLGAYTDVQLQFAMVGKVIDQVFTCDLVLPAASFNGAKDMMFLRVARRTDLSADDFSNDVYLHAVEMRYTGWMFAGQPAQ